MADDRPKRRRGEGGEGVEGSRPREEPMESFGPVTSLEPDGVEPFPPDKPRQQVPRPLTWESVPAVETHPARGKSSAPAPPLESPHETPHVQKADRGAADSPSDWSHAPGHEAELAPLTGAEIEEDQQLLDHSFLKRTFKDVHFPASKELCLRFVDQEQDFVYGQDRTVNLHNLIAHLDEEEFRSRRDLLRAIKERLSLHGAGSRG